MIASCVKLEYLCYSFYLELVFWKIKMFVVTYQPIWTHILLEAFAGAKHRLRKGQGCGSRRALPSPGYIALLLPFVSFPKVWQLGQ